MMISIRKLDNADDKYITTLSKLHMTAFPNFFLTQLGLPFLKTLYRGYMEDENSGILVAEINGKLAGFIAYSNEYSKFYKGLLKRHLIRFAACSLLAVIRHPKAGGKGIGSRLIDKLKDITDFTAYKYINLETDACDNDAVNNFYLRNGFQLARSYVTAEGRKMNEYSYRPFGVEQND